MRQETRQETKPAAKKRQCLMCREQFTSNWSGERICKHCHSTAAWREGGNPFTGADR